MSAEEVLQIVNEVLGVLDRFANSEQYCISVPSAFDSVAALLNGLIDAPQGSRVVAVLSGGNINLDRLKGQKWN